MSNDEAAFAGALHKSGRRMTGQRKLLLELIQAQSGHLDAHELHRLAQQRDPEISLATVYRTLAVLRDLGLVAELHLGEEHHHYELKPQAMHHHLVCAGCGEVIEFRSSLADKLQRAVAREHDFEITEVQVDLVGYCAKCRAARLG
jgi:Fur family transcriptional regulator, ferric uptake regulator